jgi:hypothetical protein
MTQEEMARRQRLIDNLIANGSLELAADVAKGPYRMNQGSGSPPAPPPQSPPNSADMMRSPTITSATPMGSTWNPANQPAGGPSTPPTSTGNPRYDYPAPSMSDQVRSGGTPPPAQPTINIHVTGTTPSTYEGYPTPQSQGVPTSYPPGTGLDGYMPPEWQAQVDQYADTQWGAWPGHQQQMDTKEHFMDQMRNRSQGPTQPVAMPSFASQSGNPLEWDTYGPNGAMGVWPGYTAQQETKEHFMNQFRNQRNPFLPAQPYANFGVRPPAPFSNSLGGYPGGATTWTPPYGGAPPAQYQPPMMGNLSR